LKKKLEDRNGAWAEKPPEVLWVYHTISQTSTEHMPFGIAFGMEAMIPVKIGLTSFRVENDNPENIGTTLTWPWQPTDSELPNTSTGM